MDVGQSPKHDPRRTTLYTRSDTGQGPSGHGVAIFSCRPLILQTRNGYAVAISRNGDTMNDIEIIPKRTIQTASAEVLN